MVNNLLSKPLNEHTFIEIESVINNQTLELNEYYLLTRQQLLILNELGRYAKLIEVGEAFLGGLKQGIQFSVDSHFYHLLFKATIIVNDFKKSYKYFLLRQETLPVIEKYLATYDLVQFKKITGQPYERDLELVLTDEMPNEDRVAFSLLLLELYEKSKNYPKMLALSVEIAKIDARREALPYHLLSLYELKNHNECEKVAKENLLNSQSRSISFYYLVKINIERGDNHVITILDSEYSEYTEELSLPKQKEIFELLIKFYKENEHNQHSVNFYTSKLKEVTKILRQQIKKETKETKEIKKLIDIDNESSDNNKTNSKNNLLITQFEIAHIMSSEFRKLTNENIREFLRLFTIRFNEEINFSKIIVFTTKDNTMYHYNKQRLYDKLLTPEQISDTVISDYLNVGNEVMVEARYALFTKDVITQKEYSDDIKFIYSFPLDDLGVFVVYLDYLIKPDQYYDIFKYFSEMIYLYLVLGNLRNEDSNKIKMYENLFSSSLIPFRKLELSLTSYNNAAQNIFNLGKQSDINTFLGELDYMVQNEYKILLKKVIQNPNNPYNITYNYKNKVIEEKLIGIKTGMNEVIIFSFYNDLTDLKIEKRLLLEQATVCELTGLNNLNSLRKSLPSYIENKGSLVLIRLSTQLKLIYGSPKFTDFFREFAQVTKRHFNNLTVYKYNDNELFIYLDSNDIRAVDKIMKSYFDDINNYLPISIPYERFNITASIIRYPVVTKDSDINSLFKYLEVSINRVLNKIDEYNYVYFEYWMFEQEILEQQIIDYINTGIEKSQLDFVFNPVINVKRWTTQYYESMLTIPNLAVDSFYIYRIARERNKHVSLDRFHILMVLQYLKQLKDLTAKLINVIIPIHKDTFMQSSFNQFFIKKIKEFEIDGKFISLKIINNDFNGKTLFNKIRELKLLGVKVGVRNISENIGFEVSQYYYKLDQENDGVINYLTYLNQFSLENELMIIIEGIETESQQNKIIKTNIELFSGSLYPTINPENLLLKIKNQN